MSSSLPRRFSPETASTTASQSPLRSVPTPWSARSEVSVFWRSTTCLPACSSRPFTRPMRVPTLPRMSTISRSGRRARSCAARRGEPVPTREPSGRVSTVRPSRATRASRGSSRLRVAATTRPGQGAEGRSLRECTAMSTRFSSEAFSPSSRRWRSAAANTPVPPRVARGPVSTSPSVLTVRRVKSTTSASAAPWCAWCSV